MTDTTDERPYTGNGCCTDRQCRDRAVANGRSGSGFRACNESTCMELPEGETCSTCRHETRCVTMFGADAADTSCGFFPRRFARKVPT